MSQRRQSANPTPEQAAELRLVQDELASLIYRNSSMSAKAAILLAQEIYKRYWMEKKWSE